MQVPSLYEQICLVNLDWLPVAELSKIYIFFSLSFVMLYSRILDAPGSKMPDMQYLGLK